MILCFLFSGLIVVLDQFFKQWITRTLALGEAGPDIIPGILGLTRWENDGAMLNVLSGQQYLLAGIAFLASCALIMILLRYNEGFWGTLSLAAVLGGTVGNLFDRLFNDGKVIDMFRTLFINFPIFNIADIFITLGFITFLIHFIALTIKVGREGSGDDEDKYSHSEDTGRHRGDVHSIHVEQRAPRTQYPDSVPPVQSHVQAVESSRQQPAVQQPAVQQPAVQQPAVQGYPQQPAYTEQPPAAQDYAYAQPQPAAQDYTYAGPQYAAPPPAQPSQAADLYAEDYSQLTGGYDSSTDTTPDISITLEALESELGSLDVDYDVDELLREYGLDDDSGN